MTLSEINNTICCVLQEAKCCMADFGYLYVNNLNHGLVNEEQKWRVLQLKAYIRVLTEYVEEGKFKDNYRKCVINPSERVCLNKQDSVHLGNEKLDCFHCLTEVEILSIIENTRYLCTNCNCN